MIYERHLKDLDRKKKKDLKALKRYVQLIKSCKEIIYLSA